MEKGALEVGEVYEGWSMRLPRLRKSKRQRVRGEILEPVRAAVRRAKKLEHSARSRKVEWG